MPNYSRRQMLQTAACGFGSVALAGLVTAETRAAVNPLAAKPPMLVPRAKRVIFLFMQGGPSQVDTFDHKPQLAKYDRQDFDFRNSRKLANTGTSGKETVMKSPWKFHQYGESGQWVSELFPHIAQQVDKCCFLHGLHTDGVAHGPSTLFLHCGSINLVRPSMGSWITYGLGTENENLPGFVTIGPCSTNGGPRNYSAAFLPPTFQGTALGKVGQQARDFKFNHMAPADESLPRRERQFELLTSLNRLQARDQAAEGVIHSYELAWRMQMHAPGLLDLSQESPATLAKYGIGETATDDYGRQCLMARRLAEAGVRYIQVNYSDDGSNPKWDQHSRIQDHSLHAAATDKPVAALLADLADRGLLDDTLVWWGGEFGRNPFTQGADGRDHNPRGFTHFLAGGGVKAGFAFGGTDEWGHEAIEGKLHMHDLHATLLHVLGIDHERLTFNYAGRDFRLTDVHGNVAHEILA